ncbi:MAG: SIS domain-containing protein [Lachnospiraceae bacterium]|nr:SIS domain-containing protein [Lachnospiraceae bacterium]
MYGFENETFLSVMRGAVNNIDKINEIADEVSKAGYKNIYLVGTGGTYAIISPLAYLLKTNSELVWFHEIAAELVKAQPKSLTKDSLVITASLSGTTVETIEAAKYARTLGAKVISLVGDGSTPLAKESDYPIVNAASNDNLCEEMHVQFLALGARLMKNNGEFPEYDEFIQTLKKLPEVLLKVREENDDRALAFAKKHKDTKFHMCIGAGNTWGETYCFAMCVLEEMQWISTKSIHAAEFFHGTVEMTEKDMSFMLFRGEDETRSLLDRVENFVKQYSDVIEIWDTKDYALEGISENMRKYISPMVMASQLERVSAHLEHVRDHSLDIRRYYRTVKY